MFSSVLGAQDTMLNKTKWLYFEKSSSVAGMAETGNKRVAGGTQREGVSATKGRECEWVAVLHSAVNHRSEEVTLPLRPKWQCEDPQGQLGAAEVARSAWAWQGHQGIVNPEKRRTGYSTSHPCFTTEPFFPESVSFGLTRFRKHFRQLC